jgi:hypothetical protein
MFDFVKLFAGVAGASQPVIPSTANMLIFAGYAAYGDAPSATYIRIAAPTVTFPNQAAFQDKNNNWWGLQPSGDHVDVRWFGAKLSLAVDDTVALEAAIRSVTPQIQTSGRDIRLRTVFIPAGIIRISETMHLRGVELKGAGILATTIALSTTDGTCIRMDGGAGLTTKAGITGGGLQSIMLWAYTASVSSGVATGVAVAGGKGVHLAGDFEFQPDESVFGDLKITGGGSWKYPLYLDGSLRVPTPDGKGLTGLRRVTLRNLFLGKAIDRMIYAKGVKGLTVYTAGFFGSPPPPLPPPPSPLPPPPPIVYNYDMEITGTAEMRSEDIQFIGANIQGTAWVYYTESMTLQGKFLQVSFSTAAKGCAFYGTLTTGSAGSGYFGGTGNGNEKYVATL